MGNTNDMISNFLFMVIKISTFLGGISFIIGTLCPYMRYPLNEKKEYFMYMAKSYIYMSLLLIIVHIILTK